MVGFAVWSKEGRAQASLVNTYLPTAAPRRGQLPSASRRACQRRFFTEVLLPRTIMQGWEHGHHGGLQLCRGCCP
jgi:hypothetical protein